MHYLRGGEPSSERTAEDASPLPLVGLTGLLSALESPAAPFALARMK